MDSTVLDNNTQDTIEELGTLPPLPNLFQTPLPPISNILNLNTSLISELNEALGNQQLTPPPTSSSSTFNFTSSDNNNSPYIFRGTNTTTTTTTNQFSTPFEFQPLSINISNNVFDSFSPEDIEEGRNNIIDEVVDEEIVEEEVETDSTDTDSESENVNLRRRLLRVQEYRNLPSNHLSFTIIWNFEKNYDYYKISSVKYFSQCRNTRYLSLKNQINQLNLYNNMKLGKNWELMIPASKPNIKYIYFIIYFNNVSGYIDIEYYGLFEEEINEKDAIKQLISLEIYGKTGRLHTPNMTCTDGQGFNFFKYEI